MQTKCMKIMEDDLKWRKSGITKAGNVEAEIFPIKKHKCPNENGKFKAKKLKLVSNQSLKCIRKYQSSFETSSAKESICFSLWKTQKHQSSTDSSTGYINIGDGCWRRNVLATTLRCWWRYGRFCHQHPLFFEISVGHQQPKDVTNIEILSLTSKNCHQDKVTNIHLSPASM